MNSFDAMHRWAQCQTNAATAPTTAKAIWWIGHAKAAERLAVALRKAEEAGQ